MNATVERVLCLKIIYAVWASVHYPIPEGRSTILPLLTPSFTMQLLTGRDKAVQTASCTIGVMQHAVVLPHRGLTRPRWLQKRRDRALETTLAWVGWIVFRVPKEMACVGRGRQR